MTIINALVTLSFGLGALVAFFVGVIGIGSVFFPSEDLDLTGRIRVGLLGAAFLLLAAVFWSVAV